MLTWGFLLTWGCDREEERRRKEDAEVEAGGRTADVGSGSQRRWGADRAADVDGAATVGRAADVIGRCLGFMGRPEWWVERGGGSCGRERRIEEEIVRV